MNKVLGIVLFLAPFVAFSQWSLMDESFDDYAAGDLVSDVGAANGWGLLTGLQTESCIVSADQFISGTNSGYIVDDGTNNTRATWSWSDFSDGKYSFSLSIYVPENSAGGSIGFHDSLNTELPHSISILGDTSLVFLDWEAFSLIETVIAPGMWHDIQVIFDLDNASSEFIVDQTSIGVMGTSFGAAIPFGSIEFGAYAYNPFTGSQPPGEFYIEDLNLVDELSLVGVSAQKNPVLTLAPNPSDGSFSIDFSGTSFEAASMTLINMSGITVYTENLNSGTGQKSFDVNLESGVYLIKVADATQQWISRIIIK
ncbi:MAG: T9SS type A sorting domain-containing protein [Crocinitomicaceae bacterium]